jgi:outer membrane protein assembly factor BamD (BamD/ComL family)
MNLTFLRISMNLIKMIIVIACFSSFVRAEEKELNPSEVLQGYYSNITKAEKNHNWWDVVYYTRIVMKQYPKKEISRDLFFYLAEAYFNLEQFELANKFFSEYLIGEFSPKYYNETIIYKYQMAKKYYGGMKKPIFGTKKMVKIISAKEDALKLFEEVINAMPHSDIAIDSLFYKGKIQADLEDYKESIEAFQALIRKYPKHELAIESFLEIQKVYLKEADPKHQDPNLVDMAELNLKAFKEAFPQEERIIQAEEDFHKIKEIYAQGLFEIGQYYERTKKNEASELYYKKIISSYPDTNSAKLSQARLEKIKKK